MPPIKEFKVLDHGYVRLIESWGSDERIIESARMSTNKGFLGWKNEDGSDKDLKLLKYLYQNKHMTPFEMGGLIIEVQAPIIVFREWHRHRTQSYNELSARYTELPNLFYIPNIERMKASRQAIKNKQGSEVGFTDYESKVYIDTIKKASLDARDAYNTLLQNGVAREIARLVIPVNQYSKMRASANLRNWLAFLTLRMDNNAQWEIRQYASIVAELIHLNFPNTYNLFVENNNVTN